MVFLIVLFAAYTNEYGPFNSTLITFLMLLSFAAPNPC